MSTVSSDSDCPGPVRRFGTQKLGQSQDCLFTAKISAFFQRSSDCTKLSCSLLDPSSHPFLTLQWRFERPHWQEHFWMLLVLHKLFDHWMFELVLLLELSQKHHTHFSFVASEQQSLENSLTMVRLCVVLSKWCRFHWCWVEQKAWRGIEAWDECRRWRWNSCHNQGLPRTRALQGTETN